MTMPSNNWSRNDQLHGYTKASGGWEKSFWELLTNAIAILLFFYFVTKKLH